MAPTSSSNEGSVAPKATKASKAAAAAAGNANFGMNMPLMSSAFDTAMWLNAA